MTVVAVLFIERDFYVRAFDVVVGDIFDTRVTEKIGHVGGLCLGRCVSRSEKIRTVNFGNRAARTYFDGFRNTLRCFERVFEPKDVADDFVSVVAVEELRVIVKLYRPISDYFRPAV